MELESNLFVKVLNFCCMGLFLPIFWFQKFDGFFWDFSNFLNKNYTFFPLKIYKWFFWPNAKIHPKEEH
jgi:hypothetical protein